MQVYRCTGNYPHSFQKDKVTSYNLQLLYVTHIAAAGRSPCYLQPLCGCIQSNSSFPLHGLCRTEQENSKINMTLRTVGLAQIDVGSKVIQSWRYKSGEDQKGVLKSLRQRGETHELKWQNSENNSVVIKRKNVLCFVIFTQTTTKKKYRKVIQTAVESCFTLLHRLLSRDKEIFSLKLTPKMVTRYGHVDVSATSS